MKAFRSCRLQQQITLFRFDQKNLRRLRPAARVCCRSSVLRYFCWAH